VVVVAAGVAAKGAKKAGSAAANNPAMTILLGVVGLLVVTNMIRAARGAAIGAVTGGAKKAGDWAVETFKSGAFEYQLYPGGPQGDLRNLPSGARDFVRGIFTPQDAYLSEDEMPVAPVIVPRPTPTNRAADYGESAGQWFFNISPIGTNWQYDLRRLPGTIRDIF